MSALKDKLNEKVIKIDDEVKQNTNTKIEVVENSISQSINSDIVALNSNVLEVINDNLKNNCLTKASFDIIKSPSGGTLVFTIPTLEDDIIEKELTGIILDYSTPRAYWDTNDPVEGTPPTCFSLDSVISTDGKACSSCMYNEFGSKDNGESNAKACKESVELLFLRENNIMPIVVRVPVSSKLIFQKYLTRLVSNMLPIYGVVTKITLEKTTNKTGQAYAKFKFQVDKKLSHEEVNGMKMFSKSIVSVLKENVEEVSKIS